MAGPAAVFHYAVPRFASHYEIIETIPHGPEDVLLRATLGKYDCLDCAHRAGLSWFALGGPGNWGDSPPFNRN